MKKTAKKVVLNGIAVAALGSGVSSVNATVTTGSQDKEKTLNLDDIKFNEATVEVNQVVVDEEGYVLDGQQFAKGRNEQGDDRGDPEELTWDRRMAQWFGIKIS